MSASRLLIGTAASAIVLTAVPASAAVPPTIPGTHHRAHLAQRHGALPFFDIRDTAAGRALAATTTGRRIAPGSRSARAALSRHIGVQGSIDVDPATGTARSVQRFDGALTGGSTADARDVAWSYVRSHVAALGLDDADLTAFRLQGRGVTPHGLTTLRWSESYHGIPAFDNDLRVSVDRRGRVISVGGSPVHDLRVPTTSPALGPVAAMHALQAAVGARTSARALSGPTGLREETRFGGDDIARLVIFGGYGAPRLAWHVIATVSSVATYDAVVDATTGAVLYRQNLVKSDSNATVWANYPGAAIGGSATTVNLTAPTAASPAGYLNPGATTLIGPNAHTWSDVNDDDQAEAGEEVGPSGGTDFTYPFTDFSAQASQGHCSASAMCSWDADLGAGESFLSPTSWQTNRQQNAVQAFWYVNNFHDHLASAPIGFTSPQNFEGDDIVLVNADDGAGTGSDGGPDFGHIDNANMATFPVGTSPRMQMYLFTFDPNIAPFRAINGGDAAVIVYHEYTHGLSNRLITNDDGTGAVSSPQAGAMGEAWSDWYAEDYAVRQGLTADDPNRAGDVNLGEYTDAVPNIVRTQPLDCPAKIQGSTACPGGLTGETGGYTYGDFGHVVGSPEVHSDGEIWGETLWDLRTTLIALVGDEQAGSDLAEMLVTDGMRLSPPEPSYLEARNAILAAVQADVAPSDAATVTDAVWSVFRHRGMGFFAGAIDGSDVTPVEDFSAPPAPGAPTGTISGTVTSADSGLPLSGLTVTLGGLGARDGSAPFADTTDSAGHYQIDGVPTGTYGDLAVLTAAGFDVSKATDVQVTAGDTTVENLSVRRDWASSSGGASISVSDDSGAPFGCGGDQLIDQSSGTGWSSFNPDSTSPGNPHAGPVTAIITLPQAITVRSFLADPGNTCGDGPSATAKGFTIETSPDGTTWTTAVSGNFTAADAHRLNVLTPAAGTSNIRFVRLTLLSPQDASPGSSGADFIDMSELEVLGGPPNVLPSGSLTATPGRVVIGKPILFDASSFEDPDSAITGYAWDFDGNGSVDRTTTSPTTSFTFGRVGTFTSKVTAEDFVGGGTSATSTVTVTLPAAPRITIAASGTRGRLPITLTCTSACQLTATATIARTLRTKLGLSSATVGRLSSVLLSPGRATFRLALTSAVLAAMKKHHVSTLTVTVAAVAKDANKQTTKASRSAKISR
ncbi:MAG TPA: M36 family metallopeptidase [Mycobacteriales bacterium]|nr:M36 family metallopeptidase [Mycobacteriales bacterium]